MIWDFISPPTTMVSILKFDKRLVSFDMLCLKKKRRKKDKICALLEKEESDATKYCCMVKNYYGSRVMLGPVPIPVSVRTNQ